MKVIIEVLFSFIVIFLCTYLEIYIYKKISDSKIVINKKIIVFIKPIFEFLVFLLLDSPNRLLLNFIILFSLYKIVFNEGIKVTLIKTSIIFLVMVIFELILSGLMLGINFLNQSKLNYEVLTIKNLFSILVMLFMVLFFSAPKVSIKLKKIIQILNIKKVFIINLFVIIMNIYTLSLLITFIKNTNNYTYLTNLLFSIIIFMFLYIIINSKIEEFNGREKQKILLEHLNTYEKIIDKNRINQHEILNNLLVLNSFENKNSEEFSEVLNDLINQYDNSDDNYLSNINNLPVGIKGVLYYKIQKTKNYNIKLNLYYSKEVDEKWKTIGYKNYTILCKLFGIFIDNALEAAKTSKDKCIIVDIYKKNKKINIHIENSFNDKIKINEIKKKNISTKGANRGLGLYIANKLQKNNTNIKVRQYIKNSKFITELKINIE